MLFFTDYFHPFQDSDYTWVQCLRYQSNYNFLKMISGGLLYESVCMEGATMFSTLISATETTLRLVGALSVYSTTSQERILYTCVSLLQVYIPLNVCIQLYRWIHHWLSVKPLFSKFKMLSIHLWLVGVYSVCVKSLCTCTYQMYT